MDTCPRICRIMSPYALAPRCFTSIEEFRARWHACVYEYCNCLEVHLRTKMLDTYVWGALRLVWLTPDTLLHGAFDLESIKDQLEGSLHKATDGKGLQWCSKVNQEVMEDVCLTCQTYISATRHHQNSIDVNFMTNLACLEARTKLGSLNLAFDGMPLYWQHFGAIDDLIRENCVTNVVKNEIVAFYTKKERDDIVRDLLMANRRENSACTLSTLDVELVESILKHAYRLTFSKPRQPA